jgi:hypothetical protein
MNNTLFIHDHSMFYDENGTLVNGILLGYYVGRHIVVNGFYPNYNQFEVIPIKDIIDIQALNCLIVKLGLKTHITTNIDGAVWQRSKFNDPTKTFPKTSFYRCYLFYAM